MIQCQTDRKLPPGHHSQGAKQIRRDLREQGRSPVGQRGRRRAIPHRHATKADSHNSSPKIAEKLAHFYSESLDIYIRFASKPEQKIKDVILSFEELCYIDNNTELCIVII